MPLAFKRNQFFGYTAMRRVVRRGSEFICGVCRSSHAGPSHANDCLRSCWSRYTATPVESLKKKSSILWRCRCCHREYSVQEQAGKCALECSGQLKMSYYSLSVTEADLSENANRRVMAPQSRLSLAKSVIKGTATASPKLHMNPGGGKVPKTYAPELTPDIDLVSGMTSNDTAKTIMKSPEPTPKIEAKTQKPKDATKKFIREGARYVCVVCNTKFFTKNEVEACWEVHP